MKKLFSMALLLVLAVNIYAKKIEIGYIMAGPDIYYRTSADVFTHFAKKEGYKVSITSSEYTPSKEVANVEDFIAKGVDVIILVTSNAEVATKMAKKSKEADIPIFLVSALPSKNGYEVPTGMVTGNWLSMGAGSGEYVGANWKAPKVAMIEGAYGQGIAETIRKGFLDAVRTKGAKPTIVHQASGGWMRKGGMSAAQDILATQKDFDVLYVQNEEMAAGALQAFKEAGKTGEFAVFSNNGKEMAWKWLKKGTLTGTVANPPTAEGDLVFQMVHAYLTGKKFPRHVFTYQTLLTKENVSQAMPWNIKQYLKKKAKGDFVVDLYQRTPVTEWQ